MITIAEVIEQCAKACEEHPDGLNMLGGNFVACATAIRALKAQYEGCIVAEGKPVLFAVPWQSQDQSSLYRAKEPETCKPALQVEEVEPVAHRHQWFRTGAMEQGQMRCIECGEWSRETAPPARRPLTDEQIKSVCLSYRHDFGLMFPQAQIDLLREARQWERAFQKERNDD
jgi:hypothetical protein